MKAANDTFLDPLVAKQPSPVPKDTILGLLITKSTKLPSLSALGRSVNNTRGFKSCSERT